MFNSLASLWYRSISKAKAEVELSIFYKSFLTLLTQIIEKRRKPITQIICLGLGRISTCKTAQHQLGLLLALGEHLLCPIEVFDPVFSSIEKDIISHLKLKLAPTNCEGKRKAVLSSSSSFFIFPHCPKELSNNLLYTNWSPGHLEHCILYANSFEKIRLDTPSRFLKSYHYLHRSIEIVEELAVPNNFRFPDIFNDLSLHHFPNELIYSVHSSFWESPEPTYLAAETELISEKWAPKFCSENWFASSD